MFQEMSRTDNCSVFGSADDTCSSNDLTLRDYNRGNRKFRGLTSGPRDSRRAHRTPRDLHALHDHRDLHAHLLQLHMY